MYSQPRKSTFGYGEGAQAMRTNETKVLTLRNHLLVKKVCKYLSWIKERTTLRQMQPISGSTYYQVK